MVLNRCIDTKMEIYILANGIIIKNKEKANTFIKMEHIRK